MIMWSRLASSVIECRVYNAAQTGSEQDFLEPLQFTAKRAHNRLPTVLQALTRDRFIK